MVLISDGLRYLSNNAGRTLRARYYTESIPGSVWDDDRTLTLSGNDLYLSGIVTKIDGKSSEDQVLLEQGRIRYDDTKLYINGSIQTNSGLRIFTIAISGLNRVYQEVPFGGAYLPQYLGTDIYKKIYMREVTTGSLL